MILINSSPKDALKIFQPFLPIYVPVGLGMIMAVLDREGIPNACIDEQVEDNVLDVIRGRVAEMPRPYFFGFSVLTPAFKSAIALSRRLKAEYPDCVICFGGVHPTADPDSVLEHDQVDIVFRGEAELVLPELYKCVMAQKDFTHLPGISFRSNGRNVHNARAPIITDLDSLPSFPYHRFTSPRYDLGFIVSSRGCPYNCIFCSNRVTTGKRYRYRDTAHIISELEDLYGRYNKKFVLFQDDNLLVSKKRIYELLKAIKDRGLHEKMTFSCQARGDNVSPEVLRDMYAAGFRSIFFGLETASNRLMALIDKGETVEQCIAAVRMAKQAGFHVSATFIFALPGESQQDRMDSLVLSRQLELDMVRYNNATPYPGTRLYEIAVEEKRIRIEGVYENFNSVSTFIENPLSKIPFSYVPPDNTEEQIRRDILFSYLMFYCDTRRLKRILSTREEGVGWFSAGSRMLDVLLKIPALLLLGCQMTLKYLQFFWGCVRHGDVANYLRVAKGIRLAPSLIAAEYSAGSGRKSENAAAPGDRGQI